MLSEKEWARLTEGLAKIGKYAAELRRPEAPNPELRVQGN
jgi:hypothetical protein